MSQCEYGCSQESKNQRCVRCGHTKQNHFWMHPHACMGEFDLQHIHVVAVCHCPGFTTKQEQAK